MMTVCRTRPRRPLVAVAEAEGAATTKTRKSPKREKKGSCDWPNQWCGLEGEGEGQCRGRALLPGIISTWSPPQLRVRFMTICLWPRRGQCVGSWWGSPCVKQVRGR